MIIDMQYIKYNMIELQLMLGHKYALVKKALIQSYKAFDIKTIK